MQIFEVPTDETLRSTLEYGTPQFPFACYQDVIGQFCSQCIEWHWHNEFELSLVISGTVHGYFDTERITLSTGEGVFVNSGTIHRLETDGDGIMLTLVFSPEFIAPRMSAIWDKVVNPFLHSGYAYLPIRGDNGEEKYILEGISQAYQLSAANHPAKELKIRNAVARLWESLVEMTRDSLSEEATYGNRLVRARLQKMMEYIHGHYGEKISLSNIAASANISRSEALRCFRQGIQTTPVCYLNDYRLSRVRERLISTSDAIYNISEKAGFENLSYFCRLFKKKYGVTPKQLCMHSRA